MDEIDRKIIKALKEYKTLNLSKLILKTFPRESRQVFKKRLDVLIENNIISIDTGLSGNGKAYEIRLNDKSEWGSFKK